MKVIALIPAYNEAALIGQTLSAVLSIPQVTQVLVIDDGSTDSTASIAPRLGAQFIRSAKNNGKGAALQAAADKIKSDDFDTVLLLDADLGVSAAEAEHLLVPIADGLADMVVGILPLAKTKGGFGVVRDYARKAIRDMGGGFNTQAPLSGQRALTRRCFEAMLPFAQGYGVEVALTIKALKQGFRIYEMPVNMYHRETARDLPGFVHRGKQYLDVQRTIRQLSRD